MPDIPVINSNPCRGSIRAGAAINRTPDVPTLGPSINVGTPPTSGLLTIIGGTVYSRPSNYYPHPPQFDAVSPGGDTAHVNVVTAVYGQVDPTTLTFSFSEVMDFPAFDLPFGFIKSNDGIVVMPTPILVTLADMFITIALPADGDLAYQFIFPNHLNFLGGKSLRYNTWNPIARA